MSSTSLLRIASRAQPSSFFRSNGLRSLKTRSSSAVYAVPALIATSGSASSFSTTVRRSEGHHEESFEEFTARYVGLQWALWADGLGEGAWEEVHAESKHHRLRSWERQLLTTGRWCPDTRRSLTVFRMFSSSRYDYTQLWALSIIEPFIGACANIISNSVTLTMPSHTISSPRHLFSQLRWRPQDESTTTQLPWGSSRVRISVGCDRGWGMDG